MNKKRKQIVAKRNEICQAGEKWMMNKGNEANRSKTEPSEAKQSKMEPNKTKQN